VLKGNDIPRLPEATLRQRDRHGKIIMSRIMDGQKPIPTD